MKFARILLERSSKFQARPCNLARQCTRTVRHKTPLLRCIKTYKAEQARRYCWLVKISVRNLTAVNGYFQIVSTQFMKTKLEGTYCNEKV
jgi:hypothetical protein